MNIRNLMVLCAVTVASLAQALPYETETKAARAKALYDQEQYAEAAELYGETAVDAKENLRPLMAFNASTAALRSGETTMPQEALKQIYAQGAPALNSAARYNLGVSLEEYSREEMGIVKQNAKTVLTDPQIRQLLEDARQTSDTKATDSQLEQQVQAASQYVQQALDGVNAGLTTTTLTGDAWRQSLIEVPGETQAQHNAELTALQKMELLEQKAQLEELIKQLTPPPPPDQQQQQQDQQQEQDKEKQDEQQQEQPQDQEQKDQEQQQDEQNQDQQDQPEPDKEPEQEQQQQPEPEKGEEQEQPQEPKPMTIGEMSEEDVERMLNAVPDENADAMQRILNMPQRPQTPPDKDW